ncbi:MAG: hypothetical protein H0V81_06085 [Solirubrobacterales bacterium]|nr:hypothetical protein [Solirubrobacterales bacterium]
MARVHISEPVSETRDLIERLVERLGHELLPEERLVEADALVFEPSSPHCVTLARRVRADRPRIALVAVSSLPVGLAGLPDGVERVTQPFQPADLERALTAALGAEIGRVTAVS